jgi:ABC-2 type transport system ATP-binding protein
VPEGFAAPGNRSLMPIIETRGLRKTFRSVVRGEGLAGAVGALFSRQYEEKVAVENVNISIDEGEVVGYIGPNGAGKSTTIKMLTGILVPTSGTIEVAGIVPYEKRRQNARNIGVVFGQRSQLYWDLPLRESFELLRAIYRVPRAQYRENLAHFVEILDLDRFMSTPVRQLSLGERMRGDFAAALLHNPKIVYLDEPTIGLDVVAKEAIRAFIADINKRLGTTVILTTHDLADVERLCRRIVLIDEGTVIYDGKLERLRDEYGTHRTLIVHLKDPQPNFEMPGVEIEHAEPPTVNLKFDRRTTTAEALIRRVTERYAITDVAIVEPEIDDIVRRIYLEGYQKPIARATEL